MKRNQGRFFYGVCGNDGRHAKQGDDATAFTRREEEPFAIGARDERQASLRRSRAAQIRCNVALAQLDGAFEGSVAIPATQRVSLETAAAHAQRYLALAATSALRSTRKRVTSR
jgi:hypothetical protein